MRFVLLNGYSISSKGFLPTVADIRFIWIKFAHCHPFYFTDSKKVTVHSCYLLFDHFQFTWFMDLTFQVPMRSFQHQTLLLPPVSSKTGHCFFFFSSISSFFMELFLQSPVAYIAFIHLGSSSFSVFFAFSYCSWGSQGKNTELVCHSLLQWTTFCQNSPPWPIHLQLPYMT